MKPTPWRFLVVTDLGVDAGPHTVALDGLEAWLGGLGLAVPVPIGGRTVSIPIRGAESFAPDGIAAVLSGGSSGAAVAAADLDAVLHAPAFQRVESAWLGLRLLLGETRDTVAVDVLSVSAGRLLDRFREVFRAEADRADGVSLVLLDLDFSHRAADVSILRELAGMAKVLQAPLVAAASAAFFGLRYLVQAATLPDLGARLRTPAHAAWLDFQRSEPARWTALTVNRWLQRPPHAGAGFAETVSEANPDSYLWGRGIWLVGAAAARSVRAHGQAVDLAGTRAASFEGLPTRAFPTGANTSAALAAEAPLDEHQVLEVSRAAFTPIIAPLRSDRALIPVAVTAFRPSPAQLTIEGTLGYPMLAGRLARFCGGMLDRMPAGSATECAAFLREELLGFLGAFAAEDAVEVELREESADGRRTVLAHVRVRPRLTIEGVAPEFGFVLPLRS